MCLKKYLLFFGLIYLSFNHLFSQSCLVSHYKFDGNANDSKSTNHGTNNGASLTSDRFGNANSAYQFNANQSDFISIPFAPFALPNYTYSLWIKLNSLPSSGSAFIFLSVGGTGGDQNMQIENNQNNASLGYLTGFSLTTYNGNSNTRMGNAAGVLPSTNKWYHVVCTRDTNFIKVYVNGCFVAISASSGGSLPFYGNSNQAATIGCRNNNSRYVDAAIDDVKIFGCALSPAEIYNLYNPNRSFVVTKDTTFCTKSVTGLKLKVSSNYCSYKWIDISNRKTILSTDSSLTVNINKSTTYRVFNNLNDSATVTVSLNDLKPSLGKDTVFCPVFSHVLDAGNTGQKYLWSTGDTTQKITVNTFGTFSVKVYNKAGCFVWDTITLNKNVATKISLGNDTVVCDTVNFVLNPKINGIKYLWNTNDTTKTIRINKPGVYYLKMTLANLCVSEDTVIITKRAAPKLNIGKDTTICKGETLTLSILLNKANVEWNGNLNNKSITISNAGVYTVKVVDSNKCVSLDTIKINVSPGPKSRFTVNQNLLPLNEAILKVNNFATGYNRLRYSFGDGGSTDSLNPWYKFRREGVFNVKQVVVDTFGCKDSSELSITIYNDFRIFVPQAFTPNDDGTNDVFKPVFNGVSGEDYELMIFNRWGELIFKSNDLNTGWNGTYKGEYVNTDVFMYMIKLRTTRRIIHSFNGTFLLVK